MVDSVGDSLSEQANLELNLERHGSEINTEQV